MHIFDMSGTNAKGEFYPQAGPEARYVPEAVITIDEFGTVTYATYLVTPTGRSPQAVPRNAPNVTTAITIGTV
jgi:hypothetical protein